MPAPAQDSSGEEDLGDKSHHRVHNLPHLLDHEMFSFSVYIPNITNFPVDTGFF